MFGVLVLFKKSKRMMQENSVKINNQRSFRNKLKLFFPFIVYNNRNGAGNKKLLWNIA